MIPFEEKFTAWVDGKLSGKELAAFEKELSEHPDAAQDKADMLRLGSLLRQHSTIPRLTNIDFFNHQIMERIAAETPRQPAPADRRPFFWPLRRLVLAGGLSLTVALGFFVTLIPSTPDGDERNVIAWSADPRITATTLYDSGDQNVAVVWLDGLDYVSKDIAQQ